MLSAPPVLKSAVQDACFANAIQMNVSPLERPSDSCDFASLSWAGTQARCCEHNLSRVLARCGLLVERAKVVLAALLPWIDEQELERPLDPCLTSRDREQACTGEAAKAE